MRHERLAGARDDGAGRMPALVLAALGVVFGDIGTSPLYALRECFRDPHHPLQATEANVLGVLSVIFWVLVLVISVEYMFFVLRADNRGEGGILALMALVVGKAANGARARSLLMKLGLVGAALLFADAMITPAISVLSAVEGLRAKAEVLDPYVVPTALLVLLALYFGQHQGTARVGAAFGPVVMVWFLSLGLIGLASVARTPAVLEALNPWHALRFFLDNRLLAFMVMGSVFLVVTGGEALYADMGHFGRRPIQRAWFGVVLPGLLLNYFGQGAVLLRSPGLVENLFYATAPSWSLVPLVVLATAATVIASQAVISGAFSVANQAVQLGFCPRLLIRQTSAQSIGQIYVPAVNWAFLIGTCGLVIGFEDSGRLAAAYGVAVSTTMLATTVFLLIAARRVWAWSRWAVAALAVPFLCIDVTFFTSNLLKIPFGGWLPVVFAAAIFTLMDTWKQGRELLARRLADEHLEVDVFLGGLAADGPVRVPGTAVFLTADPRGIPRALLHNLKHNKVLHETVILLTVETERIPYVAPVDRIDMEHLGHGLHRMRVSYGFLEHPDIPAVLEQAGSERFSYDPMDTTFFLGRETILVSRAPAALSRWRRALFALMSRNALSAASFFRLPAGRVVEVGYQVEL